MITRNILLNGALLDYDLTKHWDTTEPRQGHYDISEEIEGLKSLLAKAKTHQLLVSKTRHFEKCYLASIFFISKKDSDKLRMITKQPFRNIC